MRLGTVIASVVLLMVGLAVPAGAHTNPGAVAETDYAYRFGPLDGAVPCAVVCAHWIESGFTPCEKPFPPGSYVEHLTPPVPPAPAGRVAILEATLDPEIDWDSWVCEWPSRKEIASGANVRGEPCDFHGYPDYRNLLGIGCHEDMSAVVTPGLQYLLIAYNWSDVADAKGRSWVVYV